MKIKPLSQAQADRLRKIYKEHPAPVPSKFELIDGRILRFRTHQDRRASAIALFAIADKYLAVDYDRDPTTIEVGVQGFDTDVRAVVTVRPEIFQSWVFEND